MIATLPRAGSTLVINHCPIERYGLAIAQADGVMHHLARPLPETERVPGFTGGRPQLWAPSEPRDIALQTVLVDVTHSTAQAAQARVHAWLTGDLEMEWPHARGFVQHGLAGPTLVAPVVPTRALLSGRQNYRLATTIRCADSAVYARQPRRVKLDTTARPMVIGSLAVGGCVLLQGPVSGSVDLDLLAPNGALLERLALRGVALADGDVCTIRFDAPHSITKRTALGVITNVYSWRSLALSTGWWQVTPRTVDRAAGLYPLVRLSAGTGWWTYTIAEVC